MIRAETASLAKRLCLALLVSGSVLTLSLIYYQTYGVPAEMIIEESTNPLQSIFNIKVPEALHMRLRFVSIPEDEGRSNAQIEETLFECLWLQEDPATTGLEVWQDERRIGTLQGDNGTTFEPFRSEILKCNHLLIEIDDEGDSKYRFFSVHYNERGNILTSTFDNRDWEKPVGFNRVGFFPRHKWKRRTETK